jgi:hypothetical protein
LERKAAAARSVALSGQRSQQVFPWAGGGRLPHRMFINLLAFLVLSFIVDCGIWLPDNMSERNKDQDCRVISRTYCVPIPGPSETR